MARNCVKVWIFPKSLAHVLDERGPTIIREIKRVYAGRHHINIACSNGESGVTGTSSEILAFSVRNQWRKDGNLRPAGNTGNPNHTQVNKTMVYSRTNERASTQYDETRDGRGRAVHSVVQPRSASIKEIGRGRENKAHTVARARGDTPKGQQHSATSTREIEFPKKEIRWRPKHKRRHRAAREERRLASARLWRTAVHGWDASCALRAAVAGSVEGVSGSAKGRGARSIRLYATMGGSAWIPDPKRTAENRTLTDRVAYIVPQLLDHVVLTCWPNRSTPPHPAASTSTAYHTPTPRNVVLPRVPERSRLRPEFCNDAAAGATRTRAKPQSLLRPASFIPAFLSPHFSTPTPPKPGRPRIRPRFQIPLDLRFGLEEEERRTSARHDGDGEDVYGELIVEGAAAKRGWRVRQRW
ncbi:hypothetical protein C8F04DRAFT_1180884 [Mycena alexandri]|uniref:Uncharacterized protein n=1 Tax=Mycena alexandri TaxID=1745969 RepID=A0AAD6T0M3_9AGAR|nr:hypothetical protein C8F04DRAFT_1180884 [Mycena alexandri]